MQFDVVVPSLVVEPACRGPEGQANTRSQEWLKRDVISEPQLCAKADALSAARVVVRRLMVGGAGRTAPMRRIANCRSGHCDGRQRVGQRHRDERSHRRKAAPQSERPDSRRSWSAEIDPIQNYVPSTFSP